MKELTKFLKHVKLVAKGIVLGIEFQSLGAATWKDLSPVLDLVCGITSSLYEDERNERPGLYTTNRSLI